MMPESSNELATLIEYNTFWRPVLTEDLIDKEIG